MATNTSEIWMNLKANFISSSPIFCKTKIPKKRCKNGQMIGNKFAGIPKSFYKSTKSKFLLEIEDGTHCHQIKNPKKQQIHAKKGINFESF